MRYLHGQGVAFPETLGQFFFQNTSERLYMCWNQFPILLIFIAWNNEGINYWHFSLFIYLNLFVWSYLRCKQAEQRWPDYRDIYLDYRDFYFRDFRGLFFVLDYTSNYKKSNPFTKIFPFLLKPVSWFDLHIDLLVAIWEKQSVVVYGLSKTTEHHKQWVLKLSVFRVFLAHTFPHSDWMRRLIE